MPKRLMATGIPVRASCQEKGAPKGVFPGSVDYLLSRSESAGMGALDAFAEPVPSIARGIGNSSAAIRALCEAENAGPLLHKVGQTDGATL